VGRPSATHTHLLPACKRRKCSDSSTVSIGSHSRQPQH
jgi:hypothetical protein